MSTEAQQSILVQLQGDTIPPTDAKSTSAAVPDLTPVGVVAPPEPKKHAKKTSPPVETFASTAATTSAAAEAPKKKQPKKLPDVDVEDEKEPERRQHKRKRPTPSEEVEEEEEGEEDVDGEDIDSFDEPKPKKKKKKKTSAHTKSSSAASAAAGEDKKKKKPTGPRKQPGYAMIKVEDDRLRGALESLMCKREQRETTGKGRATTSTCGVLNNNLIDFYEDVISTFSRKFGRYIN